jgi:hypothetical protein
MGLRSLLRKARNEVLSLQFVVSTAHMSDEVRNAYFMACRSDEMSLALVERDQRTAERGRSEGCEHHSIDRWSQILLLNNTIEFGNKFRLSSPGQD